MEFTKLDKAYVLVKLLKFDWDTAKRGEDQSDGEKASKLRRVMFTSFLETHPALLEILSDLIKQEMDTKKDASQ